MTVEELNALANEFYEYLENQENFYEVWPDGNDTICVEVSWGDWKHDHLRLDYLAEKFFTEKGYDILSTNEDVTDEDGSDTYSAIHSYRLRKHVEESKVEEELNFSKIRFEISDDGDTIATDGNNYLILGDAELMDESDSVKKIYLKRTIDELNKYPETKSEYKYWMSILNK